MAKLRQDGMLWLAALCMLSGCGSKVASMFGLSDISGLARTYTGAAQLLGAQVAPPNQTPILKWDLLHQVNVTKVNELQLKFQSSWIPEFTATVLAMNDSAVNLQLVGFTNPQSVQLQEIAFVKDDQGNWILALQLAGVTVEDSGSGQSSSTSGLMQYASYDPAQTTAMTQNEAVVYINDILQLADSLTPSLK